MESLEESKSTSVFLAYSLFVYIHVNLYDEIPAALTTNNISVATFSGTIVQSNAVQYKQPCHNNNHYEANNVQFLMTPTEMCKSSHMFITEVIA